MNKKKYGKENYYFTKEMLLDHTVLSYLSTKMRVPEDVESFIERDFSPELLIKESLNGYSWVIYKVNVQGTSIYHVCFIYPGGYGDYYNCINPTHLEFTFLDFIEEVFDISQEPNELQEHVNAVKELIAREKALIP